MKRHLFFNALDQIKIHFPAHSGSATKSSTISLSLLTTVLLIVSLFFVKFAFSQDQSLEQANARLIELMTQIKALDEEISSEIEQAIQKEINSASKGEFETTLEYEGRLSQNDAKKAEITARFDSTKNERLQILNREIEILISTTYTTPVTLELHAYRADMERFPFVVTTLNKKGCLPVPKTIASQFKEELPGLKPVGYFQLQRDAAPRLVYVMVEYNSERLLAPIDRKIESIAETATLTGHSRSVNSVVFNYDGSLLASGGDDKLIKIWNVKQKTLLYTLSGHTSYVNSVAFHPFEQILVSGSDDGNIILWQVDQAAQIRSIYAHEGGVKSVAFSSDGNTIATGGFDKTVKIWNAADGQLIRTLTGHTDEVKSVAFSPDGWTLVSGSLDLILKLWELRDGSLINSTKGHLLWITGVAFCPDGEYIASCSDDQTVKLWNSHDLSLLKKITGFSSPITSLSFSNPDGLTLACGQEDGTLTFIKVQDGSIIRSVTASNGAIRGIDFDRNGKMFATASEDKTVKLWNIVYDDISDIASKGVGRRIAATSQSGLPPSLQAEVQFSEPSGNNYLDANETGTLTIILKNTGKGAATSVTANLSGKAPKELDYPLKTYIGDIAPDSTKITQINLIARYKTPSDSVSLVCNINEASGFNLDPIRIRFETKQYNVKLVKAGIIIDDASKNGMIETGEIVNVITRIQNQGISTAKDIRARIHIGENVFFAEKTTQDRDQYFDIGQLGPGEFRDISFKIYTNSIATEVPVFLTLSEFYREYGAMDIPLELAFNKRIGTIQDFVVKGIDAGGYEIGGFSIDIEQNIPTTGQPQNDAVALIIANRDYQNPDIPDVEFAHRDGEFMKQYLTKTFGYREGNIFLYKDATQSQFKTALQKLANAAKYSADVFFYYVGHGAPDPEQKRGYFVPVDCDPNYVNVGGIGLDSFYEELRNIKAKNIIVTIDACFSGSSEKGMIIKNISPVMIEIEKKYAVPANLTEFTSSMNDEVSSWYPEKKHSLYTYYFLKGLQGEANANKDQILTVGEMQEYLSQKIPYEARRLNNRKQTPCVTPERNNQVIVFYSSEK